MSPAPPISSFPALPAAWYLFCHTGQLRRGPLVKKLLGRSLVAFQTRNGKLALLDARCAHLGANLGCGKVVDETIQCPFHHWQFGTDGYCKRIPEQAEIPDFARLQSYPVTVQHNYVFVFNGAEPLFPMPFFDGENPQDFRAAKSFSFVADPAWHMVAAQAFDRQHYGPVHDRRLLGPPQVSCPHAFMRRNQYDAEIVGRSARDRLLRVLAGHTVKLVIDNWGGTICLVKAEFPHACNRFLVSLRPLEDGRTHLDVIVFARHGFSAIGIGVRRWFTRAHLLAEAAQVRDTHYQPSHLIAADAEMIECFRWLASLPRQKLENEQHNGEKKLAGAAVNSAHNSPKG